MNENRIQGYMAHEGNEKTSTSSLFLNPIVCVRGKSNVPAGALWAFFSIFMKKRKKLNPFQFYSQKDENSLRVINIL